MKNAWILLIALLIFIAIVIIAIIRYRKTKKALQKSTKSYKALANTAIARSLPEYKAAERRYHLLLFTVIIIYIFTFSAVSIVASRPISVSTAKPEYDNRDIMLCLDVSGSMNEYVKQLLDYFAVLIDEFKGQRIGLTIFDNVYFTVAPLSDDYSLLADLFNDYKENPNEYQTALYGAKAEGSSAIGPGLVGCVNSFDKLDEQNRSRAIILATDNFDNAGKVVSLTKAGNYAKRYNIAIYGLNTAEFRTQEEINNNLKEWSEGKEAKEFREATVNTGGAYYAFSSWSDNKGSIVVKDIVEQILEQAAARYEGAETLVQTDSPLIPTIIATISLISFFTIIWRLSL